MVAKPVTTVFDLLWGLIKKTMACEDDLCTQIMLLVSNMCAIIVTFLSVDRYMTLNYG